MNSDTLRKAGVNLFQRLFARHGKTLLVAAFFAALLLFTWFGVRVAGSGGSKPSTPASVVADRPADNAKSLTDRAEDAEKALEQIESETKSRLGAQDDNEFLCYAARDGMLDTVQRLLKKGVSVNARDREGKSVLMHAVSGAVAEPSLYAVSAYDIAHKAPLHVSVKEMVTFLLSRPGVDIHAVCDRGNNAYIYALAAELETTELEASGEETPRPQPLPQKQGPSRAVIQRLKRAGAQWPPPPQNRVQPPAFFGIADIPLDCPTLFQTLLSADTPLGAFVKAQQSELARALTHIDIGEQPHEPWVQRQALDEFRLGLVLLLNRLVGSEEKALCLYSTEEWRQVALSPAIQTQITRMRRVERETDYRETAPASVREVRLLNKMLLEHLLPTLTVEGRRAARLQAQAGSLSDYTPPSPSSSPEASDSRGSYPASTSDTRATPSSDAYVRPRWTEALFTEDERATLKDKTLTELQAMIHEIYAAAGMRYKNPTLYDTYNRQRGYAGWTSAPTLSAAQQENIDELARWRTRLRGY